MRRVRITTPLPNGRGFLVLAILAIAVTATVPARGATVALRFGLAAQRPVASTADLCTLQVQEDSDGVAVLDAAVARGCIAGYTLAVFPGFGNYVKCIKPASDYDTGAANVCQAPDEVLNAVYWAFWVNGAYSDVGVDLYRAAGGDVVVFAYGTWLTCLTPAGC